MGKRRNSFGRRSLSTSAYASRITRSLSETPTILPVRYERKESLTKQPRLRLGHVPFIHEVLRVEPNSSRFPICWNREIGLRSEQMAKPELQFDYRKERNRGRIRDTLMLTSHAHFTCVLGLAVALLNSGCARTQAEAPAEPSSVVPSVAVA